MSENKNTIEKNKWKIIIPVLGAIIGILLLLIGSLDSSKKDKSNEGNPSLGESPDANAYARTCEEQIRSLCSSVSGVGSVHVVVSLKGGYRTVYAADSQSVSGGYKNEMVLIGSGASQKAVAVGYENPEIAGIGIVCSGGNDPQIQQNLIQLVSAAFCVSSNKIFVSGA